MKTSNITTLNVVNGPIHPQPITIFLDDNLKETHIGLLLESFIVLNRELILFIAEVFPNEAGEQNPLNPL